MPISHMTQSPGEPWVGGSPVSKKTNEKRLPVEAKETAPAKEAKEAKEAKKPRLKKVRYCLFSQCKQPATTRGYCRLHYLATWKSERLNQQIKAEKRLNSYVERLAKKYPKDYLEKIKEGLESDEKFQKTMEDLFPDQEVDAENSDTENEFLEKLVRDLKIE